MANGFSSLQGVTILVTAYTNSAFSFVDKKLKSGTVYYYTLFPFRKNPLEYVIDNAYRTAAMATGPCGMAEQMYDLLPRIYHRYDTVLSHKVQDDDKQKGELRRLLDIPGSQLDQLHSFAKAALDLLDVEKVDGRLLPLLAEWIGWQTDYRNEIGLQRNEIGNAPFIYQTTGLIPNAEAAVKRISGWECRAKEFVHNVFLTNNPEKLNLWLMEKSGTGNWSQSIAPLSLDYAFEGRAATVRDADGRSWFFYHTYRERLVKNDKTSRTICNIWCKRLDENGWSPSEPLTDRIGIDKYPSAALQGEDLWLFWSVFDEETASWHLEYQLRTGDAWTSLQSPGVPGYKDPFGNGHEERKMPLAVSDDAGGLWLFWLEKSGLEWRMKYNRHDGSSWQLSSPAVFPQDDEVMEDPFLLFEGDTKSIYLFWARRDDNGKTVIKYRRKYSVDPHLSDWDATSGALPKDPGVPYDDREPAAISVGNKIELYWSSNKGRNWSVWHSTLTPATNSWETAEQITQGSYSQRDPLPIAANGDTTLIYRSNQSITYASEIYKATETTDFRYAGSTSIDMQNSLKNELYKQYEDFQAYTYDTGKEDESWYARDTVGMYLTAGSGDPALISRNRGIIRQLLAEIMPVQVRSVFSIETIDTEKIYTYDFPKDKDQKAIIEQVKDSLTVSGKDIYGGIKGAYTDNVPDWVLLYSCDCINGDYLDRHAVNCAVDPTDLRFRIWHTGLNRLIEEE